jgi:hypothetical protein
MNTTARVFQSGATHRPVKEGTKLHKATEQTSQPHKSHSLALVIDSIGMCPSPSLDAPGLLVFAGGPAD